MATDTANSLTDFDFCLALAEQAINSQLEYAWRAWKIRNNFKGKIEIFKTADGKPSPSGLEAKIGGLTVDLNVSAVKLGQVRVTLPLESGRVKYFDQFDGDWATLEFEDWGISFIVDLDKKPVDLEILQKIDPDSSRTAAEAIRKSGLPDAVFSIEYLFMKFTQVNLMLSESENIRIPSDVPKSARDTALAKLTSFLKGDMGDFLLGTVVRRNATQSTPTFALTDFIFNVTPNTSAPEASTLAYLGMLASAPMPANLMAARVRMSYPWLTRSMIDGTEESVSGVMAISKNVFMGKYLIPRFTQYIKVQPVVEGLSWKYSGETEKKGTSDDAVVDRDLDAGVKWKLTLCIKSGTSAIDISGRVDSRALMDGYTKGSRGNSKFQTEWIQYEGHRTLTGSVELTGNDIGAAFSLSSKLKYEFGDLVVDNDTVKGGAVVAEFFEKLGKTFYEALGFFGSTTSERLRSSMQSYIADWKNGMDEALKAIAMDLRYHAFIPPGGGVFTFSKPRFSAAGDLIWNVIYIAP